MPRQTIFSKMGFKPDPRGAYSELMKEKQPFYNRVTHKHHDAKTRYAKFNFPVNNHEPFTFSDEENPNLLNSVRQQMSATAVSNYCNFSKISRLSVPGSGSPKTIRHEKDWSRTDPQAPDLSKADTGSMLNSKNDFSMFIKTPQT